MNLRLSSRLPLPRARWTALLCGTLAMPVQPPAPSGLLEALQLAGPAQQAHDYPRVRSLLRAAHRFAPDHGAALYFLAREEARAGDAEQALSLLSRLAVQGIVRDVRADTGFSRLLSDAHRERFVAVAERLLAAAAPLVRSDTVRVLDDPDFVPEGIAHDPTDGASYVGSLHRRSIVRIDRDGTERTFIEPARDGLGQVLGMRVDPARRRLWVATLVLDSVAPRQSNGGGGWSSVVAYELPGGRLVSRHAAPDSAIPHLLNDIAVTRDGDVYVSDTEAHAVYVLRAGRGTLHRVHGGLPTFRFPNGIAVDPASRRLYVAHLEGISVRSLDARDGAFVMMPRPAGVSGSGIDGLYACADRLLAVQGLFGFQQVTSFRLGGDGRSIVGADALERRHPVYDWATTGALVGRDFHYLANAQLRRLSPTGALSAPTIPGRSVILRLRSAC